MAQASAKCLIESCQEPRTKGEFCEVHGERMAERNARAAGGPSRPRWPGALAAVLVAAVVVAVIVHSNTGNSGSAGNAAASFVAKIRRDANATSSDAGALLNEIQALGSTGDLYQVAADAKALHDHMKTWRAELLGQVSVSHQDQLDFVDAENDVKNAAGSIQTWAGDPNPSVTANVAAQLKSAVRHWNAAVITLWADAGMANAPTI